MSARWRWSVKLAWEPLRAQVTRAVLVTLALALATAMPVAFAAVTAGARQRLSLDLTAYGANVVIEQSDGGRAGSAPITAASVTEALRRTGVPTSRVSYVRTGLVHVDRVPVRLTAAATADLAAGDLPLVDGRWPVTAGEVACGRSGAGVLGAALGRTVTVTGPSGATRLRVVGLVGDVTGSSPALWVTDAGISALEEGAAVSRVLLRVDRRGAALDRDAKALADALPGASVRSVRQVADAERRLFDHILLLLGAVGAVVVVMTIISVTAMTGATLLERIPTLGLMRALGATALQVALLLGGEVVLLGTLAGVAGYFVGAALAFAVGRTALGLVVWPGVPSLAAAIVGGAVLAATAALPSALFAARIDPAESLRG